MITPELLQRALIVAEVTIGPRGRPGVDGVDGGLTAHNHPISEVTGLANAIIDCLKIVSQTLTLPQQVQALANLGIIESADRLTLPSGRFIYLSSLDT